jgi:prepilin peptidase CpaA
MPASDRSCWRSFRKEQAVHATIVASAIGVFAVAAYGDIRTRRIPNVLALAIAALGLGRMILAHDPVAAGYTLIAAAAMLAVGFLLFWRGIIGGGDAKLIGATALLVGYHDLVEFLFLMSLCGLPLALVVLARDKLGLRRHKQVAAAGADTKSGAAILSRSTVPYGVAISAAGAVILLLQYLVAK